MLSRIFFGDIAVLAASCRGGGRSVNEERRRLYIVGTTVRKVIFSFVDSGALFPDKKGAESLSQTAFTLKGNRHSTVEPAKRGVKRALIVPWIWCNGRTWSR